MRYLPLLLVLYSSLAFGQESSQAPEETELATDERGPLLTCPAHVGLLRSAVESLQAEVIALRRRLIEVRAEIDQLRIGAVVKTQRDSYDVLSRRVLVEAGADPLRCSADLLSGKINCRP